MEGGSWGFRRLHAQLADNRRGWDGFVAVTALEADGWREHTDQSQGRFIGGLGHAFGHERELRFIVQALDVRQAVVSGVSLEDALNRPRRAPPANISNKTARDQTQKRATLQATWRFDVSTLLEGGLWGTTKSLHHPVFQIIDQDSENRGAFVRVDWAGELGALRTDAAYGFSWREGDLSGQRFLNLGGLPGDRTASNRQRASGLDVFFEGRIFVSESLALVGGGSWGRATRDYRDHLNGSNDDAIAYEWIAPRIGMIWESRSGAQVFVNVTRSVEPPTYGALVQPPVPGFVPLDVQDAWTAEIGARGRTSAMTWDLALYRSELRGELLNFIIGPDIPAQTFNAGTTVHQGLEAGLDIRLPIDLLGGRLRVRKTWTWSDFRFAGDPLWGDNRLPVIPEHQFRAELTWRHPMGVTLTPTIEWRPREVWVDYANTLKAPGNLVAGLNATAALGENVTLYADLRNLADRRYVGDFGAITDARTASAQGFFPGEGRSAFIGLRLAY